MFACVRRVQVGEFILPQRTRKATELGAERRGTSALLHKTGGRPLRVGRADMPEHVDGRRRRWWPKPEQSDRERAGDVRDVVEHGHAVLGRGPDGGAAVVRLRVATALGQVAVVVHVPAGLRRRETRQVLGQPDGQGVRRLRVRLRVLGPRPGRGQQRRLRCRATAHGLPAAEKRPRRWPQAPRRSPSPSQPPRSPPSRSSPSSSSLQRRRRRPSSRAQRRRTDPASGQVHGDAALAAPAVPDRGRRAIVVRQLRIPGRLFFGHGRRRWRRLL